MNKQNILTASSLLFLSFLTIHLSGCAPMVVYEGPTLPKEQISIIATAPFKEIMAQKATPAIICIDGKTVEVSEIHILPGKHKIVAGFSYTPVYGVPIGMRYFVSTLEFETQSGHEYHINGGKTKSVPLMWVQDITTNQKVIQSVATDQSFKRYKCKEEL